jgi:hypothetical protein
MKENLVVFMCHVLDSTAIKRFNIIRQGLPENFDLKFVSLTPLTYTNEYNSNEYFINEDEFVTLNIKDVMTSFNRARNELLYCGVYEKFNNYKQYWFIEFDVIFRDNLPKYWNNYFNTYKDNNIDMLCAYYRHYKNYTEYFLNINLYHSENITDIKRLHKKNYGDGMIINLMNGFTQNGNQIKDNLNADYITLAFFPLCMFSNKMMNIIHKYYKILCKNTFRYFEYIIPTLAYRNHVNIKQISTKFIYKSYNYDETFLSDTLYNKLNTSSYRVDYYLHTLEQMMCKCPPDKLVHPAKLYTEQLLSHLL